MKKAIVFSIIAVVTFCVKCSAGDDWKIRTKRVNGIKWTYIISDYRGEAVLSDKGFGPVVPQRTAGVVEIPSTLDGYPVRCIGNWAFRGCESITRVIIPDTVKTIGLWAFWECFSLKKVTIPNTVHEISDEAFADCISLETVQLPYDLRGQVNDRNVFDGCPNVNIEYYYGETPNEELIFSDKMAYDGYIYGESGVVGFFNVQIAKAKVNKSLGCYQAKVVVSIQMIGEKKTKIKGMFDSENGKFSGTANDGRSLWFEIDPENMQMYGMFGDCEMYGAPDVFNGKNRDENIPGKKLIPSQSMNLFIDDYPNDEWVVGALSFKFSENGKVSIKGSVNGVKVSTSTKAIYIDDCLCIPVIYEKKGIVLNFSVWIYAIYDDGYVDVWHDGINGRVGCAGTLVQDAQFYFDAWDLEDVFPSIVFEAVSENLDDYYSLMPDGEKVDVSGRKWLVADGVKAAKVKYDKKAGQVTVTPGKKGQSIANASGLKLTYKAKDGSFKGSFYVYTLIDGKFKKQKAAVTGVLIDGVGYGTATIKKIGSWLVMIE